jgi:Cu(I)/Ag(I) efflux system membrane fusion protein
MNRLRPFMVFAAILSALALGFFLGLRSGGHAPTDAIARDEARKVLYWYDPMRPEAHFDKPGKSPFMDMELQPRYADEASGGENSALGLAPALKQNLGVKLATVEKGSLKPSLEVSGSVAFDEHAIAVVQARTGGIVERAYPLAAGDRVRAGAPLVDIRAPEWFAAQREYLILRDDPQLAAAARSRLLQLGMTNAQVEALEQRGKADAVVTFHAPRAGMLSEFDVRQGMTVMPGQTLARISGIDRVWIEAQTPETEAARLAVGAKAEARLTALPGRVLNGKIAALIPELKRETRTLRVRVALPNPEGLLKPGMLAFIRFEEAGQQAKRLLVPTDAVIATGKRHVVIAALEDGRFVPVEVTPGREAENRTEILEGELKQGDHIVVSGQFMIDSEASLRGVLARMTPEDDAAPAAGAPNTAPGATHAGTGVVVSVAESELVLTHEAIPELRWPAMTMPFALAAPELAKALTPGQKVRFHFSETGEGPRIERLEALGQGGAP